VSFVAAVSGGDVIVIGGNQNDMVQPSRYSQTTWTGTKGVPGKIDSAVKIIGYRYPCELIKDATEPINYDNWNPYLIDRKGTTR